MEINNCLIRSVHCVENPEGFSTTVQRHEIVRGPFATIEEAIRCAHTWSDCSHDSDVTINMNENSILAIESSP